MIFKTLIIIIIIIMITLLICLKLSYKWNNSKNSKIKINGGNVGYVIINICDVFAVNHVQYSDVLFKVLGININNMYPLYFLNLAGENEILTTAEFNSFYAFTQNLKYGNLRLYDVIQKPMDFILKRAFNGPIATAVFNKTITNYVNTTNQVSDLDCYDQPQNYFDFQHFLSELNECDRNIILNNYYNLNTFLHTNCNEYIYNASFIGQPGHVDYSEYARDKPILTASEVESYIYHDNSCNNNNYYWSINQSKNYTKNTKELYDQSKENLRNWYINSKIVKNELRRCHYCDNITGNLSYIDVPKNNTIDGTQYPVADIYPAYKLMMMIMFLVLKTPLFLKENPENNEKDYFKMIASYIIYANLLNICCGVRMNNDWNRNIGNICIYGIEKVNGQQIMNANNKAIIDYEIQLSLKHIAQVSNTSILQVIQNEELNLKIFKNVICCLITYQEQNNDYSTHFGILHVEGDVIAINKKQIHEVLYNNAKKVENDDYLFRHKDIFSLFSGKHAINNCIEKLNWEVIDNKHSEFSKYSQKLKKLLPSNDTQSRHMALYKYHNLNKEMSELDNHIKSIIAPCIKQYFNQRKIYSIVEPVIIGISRSLQKIICELRKQISLLDKIQKQNITLTLSNDQKIIFSRENLIVQLQLQQEKYEQLAQLPSMQLPQILQSLHLHDQVQSQYICILQNKQEIPFIAELLTEQIKSNE